MSAFLEISKSFVKRKWAEDELNGKSILAIYPKNKEIIVSAFKDNGIVLKYSCSNLGSFEFRIITTYQNFYDYIVESVDSLSKNDLMNIIKELVRIDEIDIICVKFSENTKIKKLTLKNVDNVFNPKFNEINHVEIEMALKLKSRIHILKNDFEKVLELLKPNYTCRKKLIETIEHLFYESPQLNKQGDIIDIPFGGDIWDFKFLEIIKEFNYLRNSIFNKMSNQNW